MITNLNIIFVHQSNACVVVSVSQKKINNLQRLPNVVLVIE